MSKKDEALKLALELLKAAYVPADLDEQRERTIKELEALAEQPAQGCEFCSHPLYAATKCKHCGKPAQQDIPKIGCVNHDCDKCNAQQQEIVELTAQRDFLADILTRTATATSTKTARFVDAL